MGAYDALAVRGLLADGGMVARAVERLRRKLSHPRDWPLGAPYLAVSLADPAGRWKWPRNADPGATCGRWLWTADVAASVGVAEPEGAGAVAGGRWLADVAAAGVLDELEGRRIIRHPEGAERWPYEWLTVPGGRWPDVLALCERLPVDDPPIPWADLIEEAGASR